MLFKLCFHKHKVYSPYLNGYLWPSSISIIRIFILVDVSIRAVSMTALLPDGTIDHPSLMKYDASSLLTVGRHDRELSF